MVLFTAVAPQGVVNAGISRIADLVQARELAGSGRAGRPAKAPRHHPAATAAHDAALEEAALRRALVDPPGVAASAGERAGRRAREAEERARGGVGTARVRRCGRRVAGCGAALGRVGGVGRVGRVARAMFDGSPLAANEDARAPDEDEGPPRVRVGARAA